MKRTNAKCRTGRRDAKERPVTLRRLVLVGLVAVNLALLTAARVRAQVPTYPTTGPSAAVDEGRFISMKGQPGFWRVGKTREGVWWFISPQGHLDFLNTVTTVQPRSSGRDVDGANYVSRDLDEHAPATAAQDYWARATLQRLHEIGFKGVGAWSDPVLHNYDVPMTECLNLSSHAGSMLMFSPIWSATVEEAIKTQVEPLKQNHELVGYYLDNEMNWGDAAIGPRTFFDGRTQDDPNRREVVGAIHGLWSSVESFNKDWNLQLADWAAMDSLKTLPRAPAMVYDRLLSTWVAHVADAYFHITTALLRKYDPNHLVLGIRYKGNAPVEVVRASRGYTDCQSLNYYVSDARLDPEEFRLLADESDQPLIISEFSFHALDGRSGDRNTIGFDAQVLDQRARADAYAAFTTRLARVPYVIGADWFQWMDEPPSGRALDGEDTNFGIVDVDDRPYEMMAEAVKTTAPKLNTLHETSDSDKRQDVWRDSFSNVPTFVAPALDRPIRINGELSDWPAAARIPGIRPTMAVGTDRNKLPIPNVLIGWSKAGLTLAFEVFDSDVSAAPANENWWARDNVEFWISTRPVGKEQRHYDEYCHHFFFVPVDGPRWDGVSGVVGQWHSPGDGIEHSIIPHPDIRSVTRILPDRYVTEIFIPAKALNGYDPEHHPQLAFNVQVRNYQHAAEYFWSAPKQVLTQAHPNTWGVLYLAPSSLAKPPTPKDNANAPQFPIANVTPDGK